MQTTEKLHIPFQDEINQFAAIQVQQSEYFKSSIKKQFEFFQSEYHLIKEYFQSNNQIELIKKLELVDFMFEMHMEPFNLPENFKQSFYLLKIITVKSALYHSSFFINTHNPIAHYLRTVSSHIKQKLTTKNSKDCFKVLNDNIQELIIKYQSDPSFFDLQAKSLINTFKLTKALKGASQSSNSILKTSSLKDNFTREITHKNSLTNKQKNNVFLQLAKNIKKGDWLDLQQKSNKILIKLIWKADDNSEFIFVNKEGEKVRQSTLLELAADLENNIVSIMSKATETRHKNNSVLKTIG